MRGAVGSYEDGCQSLQDYAGHGDQEVRYLAMPHTIGDHQFDEHGLRGTQAGLTSYTGKWSEIGEDVSKSSFNYNSTFNLTANPGVTYYSSNSYRKL